MSRAGADVRVTYAFTLMILTSTALAQPQKGQVVLDHTSYCRQYVQFGMDRIEPALLRADSGKFLDAQNLEVLKRSVRQRFSHLGRKWDDQAWMDDAMVFFVGLQYGDRSQADSWASTPPPPEGWTAADFDDSSWPRQKIPFMVGLGGHDTGTTLGRQRGCFRFQFDVPDPAKAGDLRLNLGYRGGVRILVNGQEVARGHLPDGPLADETPGQPYPPQAYAFLNPDGTLVIRTDKHAAGRPNFVGNFIATSWEALPVSQPPKGQTYPQQIRQNIGSSRNFTVNRSQWEVFHTTRDRRLDDVVIPNKLLRKGTNVLAVDVRASRLHPVAARWTSFVLAANETWDHCLLMDLALRDASGTVPPITARPPGVQVWVEDVHRRLASAEYGQQGVQPGVVRFVGAANGSFSAQVAISADRPLKALRGAVTDLRSDSGTVLPASCVSVVPMRGRPMPDLVFTGQGRGGPDYLVNPLVGWSSLAIQRYGDLSRKDMPVETPTTTMVEDEGKTKADPKDERLSLAKQMRFFDHICSDPSSEPSVDMPTAGCQPLWLSLKVPAAQPAGLYKGSLTIAAEGMSETVLPVEARIAAWRLPDARDFQTVVCLEQGAYGVSEQYKVQPWSSQHLALMEESFRQLARVGNDWLFVPVINRTELGNMQDSPIGWIRSKDGQFRLDFTKLDAYLDLAVRHLGQIRVICFIVSVGAEGNPAEVQVLDEASGQVQTLNLSKSTDPVYQAAWRQFGAQLYAHMQAKGMAQSMHWGYGWDDLADRNLVMTLASVTPNVPWAAGGHRPPQGHYFRANSRIYGINLTEASQQGWRDPNVHVYNPRGGGSLICIHGPTLPINYRIISDRAICVGLNGVGRMGADYWAGIYLKGVRQEGFLRPGMPVASVLWPGQKGAESSARFEALLEGVQDAEARIFLEQLLTAKALPEDVAAQARQTLFDHHQETLYISSIMETPQILETVRGWQQRSERLFQAAAAAAAAVDTDLSAASVQTAMPARSSRPLALKLRCWSPGTRQVRLEASAPWIKLAKTVLPVDGHVMLPVSLDSSALEPGKSEEGTLTVTTAGGGHPLRTRQVRIKADISPVFECPAPDALLSRSEYRFIPDEGKLILDLAPGQAGSKDLIWFNRSGSDVQWQASTGQPWITVEPPSGLAKAGSQVTMRVTALPPDKTVAAHDVLLTIAEAKGQARLGIPTRVYVVPPSQPTTAPAAPAKPAGEAMLLDPALHAKLLKSTVAMQPSWCGHGTGGPAADGEGAKVKDVLVRAHIGYTVPHEIVYKIEDSGAHSFTASVGLPAKSGYWTGYGHDIPRWVRVRFEVYADDKLCAASNWLGPDDPPHRLTVSGLAGAKQLRLVTRFRENPPFSATATWYDPELWK